MPTPSAEDHQKVLTAGNDGSFGWNSLPEGIAPYDGNPAMDGTASAGSSELFARGDHVHPADTSKANKSEMAITAVPGDNSKKNIQLMNGLATVVVTEHAVTGARIGDGENLPIEQGTIVIPESDTVNDGKLSIKVGNASPVVFSANDANDKSVTLN